MAQRVRAATRAIGYVYNRDAAQLRLLAAGLIGPVMNDLQNPFVTEPAKSVQRPSQARDMRPSSRLRQ